MKFMLYYHQLKFRLITHNFLLFCSKFERYNILLKHQEKIMFKIFKINSNLIKQSKWKYDIYYNSDKVRVH